MTRRQFREHVFKILFSLDFYPAEEAEEQIDNYLLQDEIKMTDEEKQEVRDRVNNLLQKLADIDARLEEISEGWSLKRMGGAERGILRNAVYEICFSEDTPDKVAVNEAVELAKKYCGDEGPVFVNGVLAKLMKD